MIGINSKNKKEVNNRLIVKKVESLLRVKFKNKALLKQAFSHSSYVNEHREKNLVDNERLEFLGDAVLELTVSEYLYTTYPNMSEGELTKLRAIIVCEESLYEFAKLLKFDEYVLLGKGEELTGGRKRQALLSDVFEAFLGALYLDRGLRACEQFLDKHIFPTIANDALSHMMDYKTKLQELVQQEKENTIAYKIIGERGPSHQKEFIAEVIVNETMTAVGIGSAKKDAEQQAAKKMLEKMKEVK